MRAYVTGLVFVVYVVIPAVALWRLARGKYRSRLDWLAAATAEGAFILYIVLVGPWHWLGHLPRLLWPALYLAVLRRRWAAMHALPLRPAAGRPVGRSGLLNLAWVLLFVWLTADALAGWRTPRGAVNVAFPLRGGTFTSGHAGARTRINYHFAHPAQRYALDVVAANALGMRARGLWPRELERYEVWGDTVVAPCAGAITRARGDLPDQSPPDRDSVNVAGNHVVLRCDGSDVTVLLAHLMRGSVRVVPGARVRAGDPLGRAGNSGNTTEPHLHVHAERGGGDSLGRGRGVPLTFDGRWLVRNSLVRR